jgi:hypothetical protein
VLQSVVAFGSDGRYTTERVMFCDVSRIDYSARRRYTLRVVEKRLATKTKNSKKRDVKFARAQEFLPKKKNWKKLAGGNSASFTLLAKKKKRKRQKFSKQSKARARDKRKSSVER